MTTAPKRELIYPLLIGPLNAIAATGFPWRWCRDAATALGVPFVRFGRKRAIRADLFLAALESNSLTEVPGEDPTTTLMAQRPGEDAAAAVRRMLGLKRKDA